MKALAPSLAPNARIAKGMGGYEISMNVLDQVNRETLFDLSVKVFVFHRALIHKDCGHKHNPGEVTHCFVTSIINDLMYLIICNGCNGVAGGWDYIYETRM